MENLLIGILTTAGLGWVAWVSLTLIKNSNNSQDVGGLKQSFKEMEERVIARLDKMDIRQDNFIKAEIQELKTLFEQNAS